MRFPRLIGLTAALLGSTSLAFAQSAPSNVNLVFIVDESGSMSGEHTFLGQVATDIETALLDFGVSSVNYGLVGFGDSSNTGGHVISGLTNSAGFVAATGSLVINGGTEDGFSGINVALNNFSTGGNPTTFILVTDEDRDNFDTSLSFAGIQSALDAAGVGLVVVVNASFVTAGGEAAIATDGTAALVQAGTSFTVGSYAGVTSAFGTTEADYVNLALMNASAGCAADLNVLRNGGDAAQAFSEVFVSCLTEVATVAIVTPRGQVIQLPLTNFGRTTLNILANHGGVIRGIVFVNPFTRSPSVTQNRAIIDDMFSVRGLRGYAVANGYTGSYSSSDTANGFDYTGGGIIIGSDYTHDVGTAGKLRVGASIGWDRTDTAEDGTDSSSDTTGYTAGLYAGFWSTQNWYTLATVQYGDHDIENRRVVSGTTFTATPDSIAYAGELEVGYTLQPGIPMVTGITPFVGVGAIKTSVSGYAENNGGVSLENYSTTSQYGKLGVRTTAERPMGQNTLFGTLELAAKLPFDDDDTQVQITGGSTTTIDADNDPIYSLTLETGLAFSERGTVFAQYNGMYSDMLVQHGVTLGLDYKF